MRMWQVWSVLSSFAVCALPCRAKLQASLPAKVPPIPLHTQPHSSSPPISTGRRPSPGCPAVPPAACSIPQAGGRTGRPWQLPRRRACLQGRKEAWPGLGMVQQAKIKLAAAAASGGGVSNSQNSSHISRACPVGTKQHRPHFLPRSWPPQATHTIAAPTCELLAAHGQEHAPWPGPLVLLQVLPAGQQQIQTLSLIWNSATVKHLGTAAGPSCAAFGKCFGAISCGI